ncbi:class I SAM-dependent methyltransferase [Chryseobacterium sp. JM1]|uniref:class I SAM-dependent methyltransferase n=1 Tax=Chryseobacterium sp. JM1 TaxID=1233950 RepID=UPI001E47560F|nr:class I SAM-dependent methyltransferase [Chryseobacterium sp. JM1]
MLNSLFGRIKICKVIKIYEINPVDSEQIKQIEDALKKILPDAVIRFGLSPAKNVIQIENTPFDSDLMIETLEKIGFFCHLISDEVAAEEVSNTAQEMHDFWDSAFIRNQHMWGYAPAASAVYAKDFLVRQGVENVLIPGIGYGRNAGIFIENGIEVTGIEISKTAIDLAQEYYGGELTVKQGSVTEMPFDSRTYQSVFCYGLLHLLTPWQREKLIKDCYNQLQDGGWMIFSVVSKTSPNYGRGRQIGDDTFEVGDGGQIFFYDERSVQKEFEQSGLMDFFEIGEQINIGSQKPDFIFFLVTCRKPQNREM